MNGKYFPNNICEGCLCKDRITRVQNDNLLQIYSQLLGKQIKREKINVCWECQAVLKKILKFKEQIRKAQDCMSNLLEHPPLSKLKQTKCLHVDYSNKNKDIKTENILQYFTQYECQDVHNLSQTAKNQNCTREICNESGGLNSKINIFQNGTGSRENILQNGNLESEIKIECHDFETEFNYVEADCSYDDLNLDKTNVKTVEEFDESDEEPLRRKKEKKGKRDNKRREKAPGVVMNARVMKKLQQLNVNSDHLEMVMLSWDEVEAERHEALESLKFQRHAHKCYQCALGFNHSCKLDEHMKKHQPVEGSVECESCHIQCKDKQALSSHRRRHRVRWRCLVCGGCWSRASVAADHVHRHHAGPAPTHTCNMCGHRESTLGKLRNHIKKSHAGQHKCELCDKVFRDKTSLRKHLFIHSGVKEYSCSECGKQFLFKKAMEIHLVTHQSSAFMYCHQCDMTFKNQMSYNQHMKYNLKHIDPAKLKYACKLCDKKFVKATRLEEHNMAVHLKITHIPCPVPGCTFACSSRAVLRSHRRAIHAQHVTTRNHVCELCGKAYTTKKSLEGHLRTHSGERPFRCAKCPAAFGYESALYNHNKLVHLKHKVNSNKGQTNSNWIEIPAE